MPLSVSYKPFGHERGREVGRVLIIDPDVVASDPSAAASAEGGGVTVMLTPAVGDAPGTLATKPAARPKPSPRSTASRSPTTGGAPHPTMTMHDREITQAVEPDDGLEGRFIGMLAGVGIAGCPLLE